MKFMQWLGKIVIGTVLISSLSVCTTWYVVNMYVEDIFRQFQIPALGKKVQFSDFAARLGEELNIVKPRDGGKRAVMTQTEPSSPSTKPEASSLPSPNGSKASTIDPQDQHGSGTTSPTTKSGAKAEAKDDSVAVMGRVQTEAEAQKKDLVLSTEDFAKKKEALSSDDKMKVFSLLVAKLPQNEVQHLSALLEDGITSSELKEVDLTLKKYLNEQEYKQLMEIIGKY
ncbi:hypothetical protein GK047_14910 [Paenibacillus sp. SYP-B3998]|uniref:Uncharacterized protein n=1 Tax=Paenibacillus sp. SYP-B3998 TaxID=2678564 RepID=A0A6G3ZYV4_9BACL|nr:hypothetical protein [Paenibacillus sp. SYP-B3998]NEW07295.1 hypothetical protein [Paenibacillus sp. SYP-B3998]